MNIQKIDTKKLHYFDFLKELSFYDSVKKNNLKNSIEKIGIQNLPVITFFQKKYFLIDGHLRLDTIMKHGDETVEAVLIETKSEKEILTEFCKRNSLRGFNDMELSNILNIIESCFHNDNSLIDYVFEILNLKKSEHFIRNLKMLKNLTYSLKKLYIDNKLNKNIALKLVKLSKEDQNIFSKLILKLKLNGNNQKRCFNMLFDLSGRLDSTFSRLINEKFNDILYTDYTRNLEDEFFAKLTSLHSPNFTDYYKKFNLLKEKLDIKKKRINIYSPNFFEDGIFKLEVFFRNFSELNGKIKHIKNNIEKVKKNNEFEEFFD